jgi:hypothetical protein
MRRVGALAGEAVAARRKSLRIHRATAYEYHGCATQREEL